MPPFVLIGLAAGLASAALFAAATAGGLFGRVFLYFLAPLPMFLAGLGWGAIAAAIGGIAGSLATTLILGARPGLVMLVSQGLPVAMLCHLALLNRSVPSIAGPQSTGLGLEWYPIGRLVAGAALAAGLLAFFTLMLLGTDLEAMRALLRELIEKVLLKQFPAFKDRTLGEPEIKALTEVALYTFPAASALSWLGGLLFNLYLAGRITQASGRLRRPWPDLAAMSFPRGFGLAFATALALAALLSGYPALLASGFAGAFFFAYLLMGLAIVHFVTRGTASRPFILWGVYVALLILNTWAALLLAVLAAVEPLVPWRRKRPPGPPPPA